MKMNNNLKWFVIKNTWIKSPIKNFGWGNGYIAIPPTSNIHGKNYDEINKIIDENGFKAHKTITFSELGSDLIDNPYFVNHITKNKLQKHWIIGFDTIHSTNNKINYDKNFVINETKKIYNFLKLFTERKLETKNK